MRNPLKLIPAIVLGLSTVLFASQPTFAAEMSQEAQELVKLDDDWSAAATNRDVEKVASYYAKDTVVYPPNDVVAVGRDKAKEVWAGMLADPSLKISWKATAAEVAKSGEMGFTAGTYQLTLKDKDGKTISDTGKYLCVWRKNKQGKWLATHDMWNSDLKP